MNDAYARAGVDTAEADSAVDAIVGVLSRTATANGSRVVPLPGHYASVLEIAPNLGIAFGTDGVGTKLIVAEQANRYREIGIDCVAMCVNDLICVGATPVAMVDYVAVELADPAVLAEVAEGLRDGAEQSGIEIPGGELAQVPELVRGHPSPRGLDLVGAGIGTVALDKLITGQDLAPGDVVIGLPSSGVHSNGLTLARRVLLDEAGLGLDDQPSDLAGSSVADVLLAPTVIYVQAILELLASDLPTHGLAHITGGGVTNLRRLNSEVGFMLDAPLPIPAVFTAIEQRGEVARRELFEVFNMGCGFCVCVPESASEAATSLLAAHHPGARPIGHVTDAAGRIELPDEQLVWE